MHPDCYNTIACGNMFFSAIVTFLIHTHFVCFFTVVFQLNEDSSPQSLKQQRLTAACLLYN